MEDLRTASDVKWAASQELRDAFDRSKDRKTVEVEPVRTLLYARINQIGRMASEARFEGDIAKAEELIGLTQELAGLLHTFDCYNGFNSRMWRAFCRQDGWHSIVTTLHAIDERKNGHRGWRRHNHYARLLRLLDWPFLGLGRDYTGREPCVYYPASIEHTLDQQPTEAELARARRIRDLYAKVLGV